MAYDLMTRLLQVAEIPVERVAVTQLRDNIFYATVWVKVGIGCMGSTPARATR